MQAILMRSAAALVVLVAIPAMGDMQPLPQWYAGVSGAVSFMDKSDIGGGKLDFSPGESGTLTLGYAPNLLFQPLADMRFDAELGYHRNEIGGRGHGAMSAFSYMANAYYDFHNPLVLTPYIGGGLGEAQVHLARNSGAGNSGTSNNVFAYQLMAGVYFTPPALPKTDVSLGYRYFVLDDPSFRSVAGKIKLDNVESHNIEIGARYRF